MAASPHVIERTSKSMMKDYHSIQSFQRDSKKDGSQFSAIATVVANWPNLDVWPYKIGVPSLAVLSAGTCFYINKVFREALLLDHRMRLTSYLGLMFISGSGTMLLHTISITRPIFQNDPHQCPVCIQMRAPFVQLGCGLLYPMIMVPLMSYTVASSFKNRHLPKVYSKPKEVVGYFRTIFNPMKGKLGVISAVHVILSMAVTYFEQVCFHSKIVPVLEGKETFAKPPIKDSDELTL